MTALTNREEISRENFNFLRGHVYKECGIVLDEHKGYLLEARLAPIVGSERLNSLNELCFLLRRNGGGRVSREVIEALTTNETLFFRDATPFKVMRDTLIPALVEERRRTGRRLRFWSAASSSGQEAYSLAMMLCEMGLDDWDIQIVGTDINEKMVERARSGVYLGLEIGRGLPTGFLGAYFEQYGMGWRVKDKIRRMARFEPFDLRRSMRPFGEFDFVLCRNVLIYFDVETKRRILTEIATTMPTGSHLLLGTAENTLNVTHRELFEQVSIEGVSFYRRRERM